MKYGSHFDVLTDIQTQIEQLLLSVDNQKTRTLGLSVISSTVALIGELTVRVVEEPQEPPYFQDVIVKIERIV